MIRLNTTISVQYIPGKRDLSKNSSKQPLTQPKGEWMIYLMTSKTTGRQYVGVTNDLKARMMNHISDANNPRASTYKTAIATAVRTLGIEDFEIKILDADDDKEYAYNVLERGYIELHKTRELGYNMCSGGIGANGRPVTDEQRKAQRVLASNKQFYAAMHRANKGKKYFTNGLKVIRLTQGAKVPAGFKPGRKLPFKAA